MRASEPTTLFLDYMIRGLAADPKVDERTRFQLHLPFFVYGLLRYDPVKYRILDTIESCNINSFLFLVDIKGWENAVEQIHMLNIRWIPENQHIETYKRYNLWAPYPITSLIKSEHELREALVVYAPVLNNHTITLP